MLSSLSQKGLLQVSIILTSNEKNILQKGIKIMKVKFRGKTLNIKNESDKCNEFYAEWNGYSIKVIENEKSFFNYNEEHYKNNKYDLEVINPLGIYIVINYLYFKTISESLQCAFDNIDLDLKEMEEVKNKRDRLIEKYGEETVEEIAEIIEKFNNVGYLLDRMKY